jgi:hypothetical protein
VEEAIGASLGKSPAQVAAETEGNGGKVRKKASVSQAVRERLADDKK